MLDIVLLAVAIAMEVAATCLLKTSNGLTRFWPSVGVVVGYLAAFFLLALALKRLPVGPVYAVWAGLGTAATAIIGTWLYGDRLPTWGWIGVALIVIGVVLLGASATHTDDVVPTTIDN